MEERGNKSVNIDKKRKKKAKLPIKHLEHNNIMPRLKTEFDDKKNNLRNDILKGIDKKEYKKYQDRNGSSTKKEPKRNKRIIIYSPIFSY